MARGAMPIQYPVDHCPLGAPCSSFRAPQRKSIKDMAGSPQHADLQLHLMLKGFPFCLDGHLDTV